MTEAQMLIELGFKPSPKRKGFPCPSYQNSSSAEVYDREQGGYVILRDHNNKPVPNSHRPKAMV